MNRFTNVLKAVGSRVASIIGFTAPLVNQLLGPGRVGDVFSGVAGIVQAVEGMFQSAYPNQQTGPQKLLAALPFVSTMIKNSEVMLDKEIADEEGFVKGAKQVTEGIVAILNASRHRDKGELIAALQERGLTNEQAQVLGGQIPLANAGRIVTPIR